MEDTERIGIAIGKTRDCHSGKRELPTRAPRLPEFQGFSERIVNALAEALVFEDSDGIVAFVNPAMEKLTGYSAEELVGHRWREMVPIRLLEQIQTRSAGLHAGGADRYEASVLTRDGREIPVLVSACGLFLGETSTGTLVAIADITVQKQAEEALRESERRYRLLVDSAPLCVLSIDLQGNIVTVNRSHLPVPGNPSAADLPRFNVLTSPAFRETGITDEIRRCLDSGKSTVSDHSFLTDQGHKSHLRLHLSAMRVPEGDITGVLAMVEDTTDRIHLEERIRQRDRITALGRLAGGVAHDFNNILTGIILSAETLKGNPSLEASMLPGLQTILSEAERAGTLVRQILDFSHRSFFEPQHIDLTPVVQQSFELLRRTLPESIDLLLEVQPGQYVVNADRSRIHQVLTNLALNAHAAMPSGGELRIALSTVTVRLGCKPPVEDMRPGDWVCVSVSDTGVGMSPEVTSHLFEPFFTTRPVGEGSGMGLAQVHGIVTQHSGHISYETEPDKGTVFRIYLPAQDIVIEENVQEKTVIEDRPTMQATILVVEDEPTVRRLGRRVVEALGYRVLTADNGQQALEIYRSAESVDLVVTDMVMPGLGGRGLMRELRRLDPALKGLILTGYALQEDLQELNQEGIVDVVHKPFSRDRLAHAIQNALLPA